MSSTLKREKEKPQPKIFFSSSDSLPLPPSQKTKKVIRGFCRARNALRSKTIDLEITPIHRGKAILKVNDRWAKEGKNIR